jgi:prephenate dehydrogenase
MGFGSTWRTIERSFPLWGRFATWNAAPPGPDLVGRLYISRPAPDGGDDNRPMRIALLGFGLIGGSIARALRAGPGPTPDGQPPTITAWTPRGAGPDAGVRAGVVDRTARHPADAVRGADLVVLAGPPLACLDLIDELAGPARSALDTGALVTDVASTKVRIVERAAAALPFVGGHPMAGVETSGFAAARADLFTGRPWIVVPGPSSPVGGVERVVALANLCGARPLTMSAPDHDEAVAGISHLPLVVAVALVEAVVGGAGEPARPDWPATAGLAAGGWASMTRLARGDVAMAAGIAATNGPAIAGRLRELRRAIDRWLDALDRDDPDAERLAEWFGAARERLETDSRDGPA